MLLWLLTMGLSLPPLSEYEYNSWWPYFQSIQIPYIYYLFVPQIGNNLFSLFSPFWATVYLYHKSHSCIMQIIKVTALLKTQGFPVHQEPLECRIEYLVLFTFNPLLFYLTLTPFHPSFRHSMSLPDIIWI